MKNKKGFTLIELIVVVAIIGILVAILVPSISGQFDNAKETAAKANAKTFYSASQTAVTTILAGWDVKGPVTQTTFDIPSIYYESGEYRVYFGKSTADSSGEVEPISNAVRTGYVSADETKTTDPTDLQTVKEINKHMKLYLGENSKLTTDKGGYQLSGGTTPTPPPQPPVEPPQPPVEAPDSAKPADVTMKIKTTGKNATGTFAGREYQLEVTGLTKDAKYKVTIAGKSKGSFTATGATQTVDLKGAFEPVVMGQTTTYKAELSVVALNPATGVTAEKGSVIQDLTFYDGDGSTTAPYLICDPESLQMLSDKVNNDNANFAVKIYKQVATIDMASVANFVPIGTDYNNTVFKGTYDGGAKADGTGYEIKNLTIDRNASYKGLFGYAQRATLKNIRIGSGSVIKGGDTVGGIVGQADSSTIENCHNSATVTGADAVGGIAGLMRGGSITQSSNTGDVTGTGNNVGGIIGLSSQTDIINCNNSAAVSGSAVVGGITGEIQQARVLQSSNTGAVTASRDKVGGITGNLYEASIIFSFNTGRVEGKKDVGGVVGLANGNNTGTPTIAQVYNTGSVNSSAGNNVGGVIGAIANIKNLTISNSYNAGEVRGADESVGGVLGLSDTPQTTTLINSFNTGNVTGKTGVGGALGAYTDQGTFTNVLFKNTVVVTGTPDANTTAYNVKYTNISEFLNATGADRKYWDNDGRLLNADGTLMAGPNPGGA